MNLVLLTLGAASLIGFIIHLGPEEVWQEIRRVGWFFFVAFGLYVLRLLVSAIGWKSCINSETPNARTLDFFYANWAGHAINQLTPAASMGEWLKGSMLLDSVQSEQLIASIITYNFLNSAVVQVYNMLGPIVCLFTAIFPKTVVLVLFGVALLFLVPIGFMYLLLRWGVVRRLAHMLTRLPLVKIRDPDALIAKAKQVDRNIRELRLVRPRDFWKSVLLIVLFRLLQAAEIFLLLMILLPTQDVGFIVLLTLLTQTSNQLIDWVASIVPGKLGVAEGGIALLFEVLQLDPRTGLSLQLMRRLLWVVAVSIGLLIGFWQGLTTRKQAR